jgi:hypothetical protein
MGFFGGGQYHWGDNRCEKKVSGTSPSPARLAGPLPNNIRLWEVLSTFVPLLAGGVTKRQ